MVNIGFSGPEPRYNTAGYGEPGWHVVVLPRPTAALPLRAVVSTPCARGAFESPEHTRLFAKHGDEASAMVTAYLEWTEADR